MNHNTTVGVFIFGDDERTGELLLTLPELMIPCLKHRILCYSFHTLTDES